MLHFDRNLDPRKNADLFAQITQNRPPIKQKVLETEQLFELACQNAIPFLPDKLPKSLVLSQKK